MEKILLPPLGEGIDRAIITGWNYQEGDHVRKDDDLVEVVVDKASFLIPAPLSGILKEIKYHPHDEIKVGQTIAIIQPE